MCRTWFKMALILGCVALGIECAARDLVVEPVLKRRVRVISPADPDAPTWSARLEVGTGRELLQPDLRRERMTGADLLMEALVASGDFTVMRPIPGAPTPEPAEMVLYLGVMRTGDPSGWSLTLLAMEPVSGVVRSTFNAGGTGVTEVIPVLVAKLREDLALRATILEVTQISEAGAVVFRGRDDGLLAGTRLSGHRPVRAEQPADPEVSLITARRLGNYEAAVVRAGVSLWRPVAEAPPLAAGDLLELPAVELRSANPRTRARDAQDALFKKNPHP